MVLNPVPVTLFTPCALDALARAQGEAEVLGSPGVEDLHLLLAFTQMPHTLAAHTLGLLGIRLPALGEAVRFILRGGRAGGRCPGETGDVCLAPSLWEVLHLARREARNMGHSHINTLHLLVGMLRGEGTSSALVLEALGLTLSRVGRVFVPEGDRWRRVGLPYAWRWDPSP